MMSDIKCQECGREIDEFNASSNNEGEDHDENYCMECDVRLDAEWTEQRSWESHYYNGGRG